jgi:hypothetical protein
VAELIDAFPIATGTPWWIHRLPEDRSGEKFTVSDHRRNWRKGRIVRVSEDYFYVKVPRLHIVASPGSAAMGGTITGIKSEQSASDKALNSFDMKAHRRRSLGGAAVVDLKQHSFSMKGFHDPFSEIVEHKLKSQNATSEELLEMAVKGLRCIDWDDEVMERLVLSGPVCGEKADSDLNGLFELSRPVREGESIDYFLSHSWHDDKTIKLTKLQDFADDFKKRKKRNMTIWLDKVCIDQQNISDGLKVLPINVMACKRMLVLCGDTYCNRLWCVWELCTLFFMKSIEDVLERVVLVPLHEDDVNDDDELGDYDQLGLGGGCFRNAITSSAESARALKTDIVAELEAFSITNAHCYDPNEEDRLKAVIKTVGEAEFHKKVHELGAALRANSPGTGRQRTHSRASKSGNFKGLASNGTFKSLVERKSSASSLLTVQKSASSFDADEGPTENPPQLERAVSAPAGYTAQWSAAERSAPRDAISLGVDV